MCDRWIFTVPATMNMRAPISALVSPSAVWRATSRSVGVRLSQPPDGRSRAPRALGGAEQARGLGVALQAGGHGGQRLQRVRQLEPEPGRADRIECVVQQPVGLGPVLLGRGDPAEHDAGLGLEAGVGQLAGDRQPVLRARRRARRRRRAGRSRPSRSSSARARAPGGRAGRPWPAGAAGPRGGRPCSPAPRRSRGPARRAPSRRRRAAPACGRRGTARASRRPCPSRRPRCRAHRGRRPRRSLR